MIENLVDTMWLYKYLCPLEITYEEGSEFIAHGFKNILVEEK